MLVAAERDLKMDRKLCVSWVTNTHQLNQIGFSVCWVTIASLPFPGLLPLTDELHLLQYDLWMVAGMSMKLGGLVNISERHVFIWNSYSVRGFRSSTCIRPFWRSVTCPAFWKRIKRFGHMCTAGLKTDVANTHKGITGVITLIYPGAIFCAEPDVRVEMLGGFTGVPLQQGCQVIPKLYLHNLRSLWNHCKGTGKQRAYNCPVWSALK